MNLDVIRRAHGRRDEVWHPRLVTPEPHVRLAAERAAGEAAALLGGPVPSIKFYRLRGVTFGFVSQFVPDTIYIAHVDHMGIIRAVTYHEVCHVLKPFLTEQQVRRWTSRVLEIKTKETR